jgi:hypothetical protein
VTLFGPWVERLEAPAMGHELIAIARLSRASAGGAVTRLGPVERLEAPVTGRELIAIACRREVLGELASPADLEPTARLSRASEVTL